MYEEVIFPQELADAIAGGVVGALIAMSIVALVVLLLALYIYFSMAWMTIARKLNYKHPWLAWIPIANFAMMLQMGRFHWAWIFLVLVPIVGWLALLVMLIIATWRIFEMRRYPGWFSLSMVIPQIGGILYLIAIGFVAWKDKPRITPYHQFPPSREKERMAAKNRSTRAKSRSTSFRSKKTSSKKKRR